MPVRNKTAAHPLRLALAWLPRLTIALAGGAAMADSSGPRLAAYYDLRLAICDGKVYEWHGSERPRAVLEGVERVGVGRRNRYALTPSGRLLVWRDRPAEARPVADSVRSFAAGRSGLLVIGLDGRLHHYATENLLGFGENLAPTPVRLADGVLTAAVGDSADYYVTDDGRLWVRGQAHRGQYGDGRLRETPDFVRTAVDVTQVVAHTGHALHLKRDGSVWGTGGNRYGPLGRHGFGDKAAAWGRLFQGARAIATGSRHSLAIDRAQGLWIWGDTAGLEPRRIMTGVRAVAAGRGDTIALTDERLWQWPTGAQPRAVMACR